MLAAQGRVDQIATGGAEQSSGIGFAVSADILASEPRAAAAAAAGPQPGDVVIAADRTPITGARDLVSAIAARRPGDRITLTVRRDTDTQHVTNTLGRQPT